MPTPILNLNTEKAKRVHVAIDGKAYALRSVGLHQAVRLELIAPRIGELLEADSETDELSGLLTQACVIALDAPAAVLAKLSDLQKAAIFRKYLEAASPTLLALRQAFAPPPVKGARRG